MSVAGTGADDSDTVQKSGSNTGRKMLVSPCCLSCGIMPCCLVRLTGKLTWERTPFSCRRFLHLQGPVSSWFLVCGIGSKLVVTLIISCSGERSLFCVTQKGVLRFMKKLDFSPSCFFVYQCLPTDEGTDNVCAVKTLLSSDTNQLLVLQDSSLIWTATLPHTPVQLCTANFQ